MAKACIYLAVNTSVSQLYPWNTLTVSLIYTLTILDTHMCNTSINTMSIDKRKNHRSILSILLKAVQQNLLCYIYSWAVLSRHLSWSDQSDTPLKKDNFLHSSAVARNQSRCLKFFLPNSLNLHYFNSVSMEVALWMLVSSYLFVCIASFIGTQSC